MNDSHLIPEIVKSLAARFDPNNRLTNQSEKFQAEAQLRAIITFCEKSLETKKEK